jgi:mannose-6-phosphate isomerase-like protein (cupin superfamily)
LNNRWLAALVLLLLSGVSVSAQGNGQTIVVDTQTMPWERGALHLSSDWVMKVLENSAMNGRRVALAYLPPGRVSKEKRHFHQFRQWFYLLDGDIPVFDYTSPEQKKARINVLRKGYFMERPSHSMHGEEGNPRSQGGTLFLMWLGNSLPIVEVPFEGPFPQDVAYEDDRMVDTRAMDWIVQADGTLIKTLAADVRLLLLPPSWKGTWVSPSLRSVFVISGSGTLHAAGALFGLRDGTYIRQPAGEPAEAVAGEVGCLLIEWYATSIPRRD